jgi:hypothetical protein
MIDPKKLYKTRSGLPVRLLCTDRGGGEAPVIGLVKNEYEKELLYSWLANGSYYNKGECDLDLIEFTPQKREQTLMIDMNKKYKTRSGMPVRLLCTDRDCGGSPIIGLAKYADGEELLYTWRSDGAYYNATPYDLDLVEVDPYQDWLIDDKIYVRDAAIKDWTPAHFAGVSQDGSPTAWFSGRTSHTENERIVWPLAWNPRFGPVNEDTR